MNRTELREHIFRMLFRVEFHPADEYEEQMTFYIDALAEPSEKDVTYMTEKTAKIIELIPQIDAQLNEKVSGWSTRRMTKIFQMVLLSTKLLNLQNVTAVKMHHHLLTVYLLNLYNMITG